MTLTLIFAVVVFFSVLGYWKENCLPFMLAAGTAMVLAFTWYDVDTTPRGLGISLMIWAYSIICLVYGFILIFKSRRAVE